MVIVLLIILIIIFGIGLVLDLRANKLPSRDRTDGGEIVMGITGMIAACLLLVGLLGAMSLNGDHLDDRNTIIQLREQREEIVLHKERVEDNIRESLSKYPGLEKEIIEDIDPIILVNYPELKSSETITQQFEALSEVEDRLYKNKSAELQREKDMRVREQNPVNWGLLWV